MQSWSCSSVYALRSPLSVLLHLIDEHLAVCLPCVFSPLSISAWLVHSHCWSHWISHDWSCNPQIAWNHCFSKWKRNRWRGRCCCFLSITEWICFWIQWKLLSDSTISWSLCLESRWNLRLNEERGSDCFFCNHCNFFWACALIMSIFSLFCCSSVFPVSDQDGLWSCADSVYCINTRSCKATICFPLELHSSSLFVLFTLTQSLWPQPNEQIWRLQRNAIWCDSFITKSSLPSLHCVPRKKPSSNVSVPFLLSVFFLFRRVGRLSPFCLLICRMRLYSFFALSWALVSCFCPCLCFSVLSFLFLLSPSSFLFSSLFFSVADSASRCDAVWFGCSHNTVLHSR